METFFLLALILSGARSSVIDQPSDSSPPNLLLFLCKITQEWRVEHEGAFL